MLPALLDDAHLCLEHLLVFVGGYLVQLRVAAAVDICLELCLAFGNMQLVEDGLQIVDLVLLGCLFAMCNFLHTVQHLFLGFIDLALFGLFFYFRNCLFFYFRSSRLLLNFFTNPLFEDVFLRVHN